ncbi:MAG: hypothetical protein ACKOJF_30020 [Planctomycetaceae bacterium]
MVGSSLFLEPAIIGGRAQWGNAAVTHPQPEAQPAPRELPAKVQTKTSTALPVARPAHDREAAG